MTSLKWYIAFSHHLVHAHVRGQLHETENKLTGPRILTNVHVEFDANDRAVAKIAAAIGTYNFIHGKGNCIMQKLSS